MKKDLLLLVLIVVLIGLVYTTMNKNQVVEHASDSTDSTDSTITISNIRGCNGVNYWKKKSFIGQEMIQVDDVNGYPSWNFTDDDGIKYSSQQTKIMHTTMQTLGRFAIIGGFVLVALVNVVMFAGVDALSEA